MFDTGRVTKPTNILPLCTKMFDTIDGYVTKPIINISKFFLRK